MRQHTIQTPYMVGEVHFYSIERDSGLALFDTGPPTPEGEAALLANVDLKRLKYLFITHCHVDHYGLANFILHNSDAEVFIPRKDAIKLQRHDERMACIAGLLCGYGFGEDFAVQLRETFTRHKLFSGTPERFRVVEEAEELAEQGISCLHCPGHSQSDLIYLLNGYAVTGDVLLRDIFQAPLLDIDLDSFSGRFKNYDAYCRSLLNLAQIRGRQIMPGHRQYVNSLDDAVLYYIRTLFERAAKLLPFRNLPINEIIERLFKGRLVEPFFIYLKVSEIIFMLDFIEQPELLKASLEQIGLFEQARHRYEAFI
ncbi:MAG: MBL fold metallo-hydrolase [Desulfuromonadaceae bacterium]|nr:MBL fold metallo-hydrolase [Desulfuromonadaceae bacterium]